MTIKRIVGWLILASLFGGITVFMSVTSGRWWQGPVVLVVTFAIAGLVGLATKWTS